MSKRMFAKSTQTIADGIMEAIKLNESPSGYHHSQQALEVIFDKLVWLSPDDRRKLLKHLDGGENERLCKALGEALKSKGYMGAK